MQRGIYIPVVRFLVLFYRAWKAASSRPTGEFCAPSKTVMLRCRACIDPHANHHDSCNCSAAANGIIPRGRTRLPWFAQLSTSPRPRHLRRDRPNASHPAAKMQFSRTKAGVGDLTCTKAADDLTTCTAKKDTGDFTPKRHGQRTRTNKTRRPTNLHQDQDCSVCQNSHVSYV